MTSIDKLKHQIYMLKLENKHLKQRLKELNSILLDNNIFSEKLFVEKNINVEGELINVKIFGESKEYIYINNMPLKIDF